MRKLSILGILILGACAQRPPAVPSLRSQLMARCASACQPAEVVEALIAVDETDDLWQCHCKTAGVTATPSGI